MRLLAIIPARKGSKGVVGKNKKLLGNIPLVEWTMNFAKSFNNMDTIVSTDDAEILKISRKHKIIDYGLRPSCLSADHSLTIDVLKYELDNYQKTTGKTVDGVMLLQPTCPFRLKAVFEKAIKDFISNYGKYSYIGVKDVEGNHPFRMKIIKDDFLFNFEDQGFEDMRPRQELPRVYLRNGSIYLTSAKNIKSGKMVGKLQKPVIMNELLSINIDSNIDFVVAENFLNDFLTVKDF